MEYFERLGRLVDDRWLAVNRRESEFPRIAFEALRDEPMQLDPLDPARWLLCQAKSVPEQIDLQARFGQPPLVMFATTRFVILVLYWLESTTSVHQHGFSGAFQVAGGSSLHSQFDFEVSEHVNDKFRIGQLSHRASEFLAQGATRLIPSDHGFIHSLFHLQHPSVSVVVRMLGGAKEPQYVYFRPGVSLDPFFEDPLTRRQVQVVRMLASLKHPEMLSLVGEVLERSEPFTVFLVLKEILKFEKDPALLKPYSERARRRHGSLVDAMEASLWESARDSSIARTRKEVKNPDHRFLLALLLNVPRQEVMLDLIRSAYPGSDPRELVLQWLTDLSNTPNLANTPVGFSMNDSLALVARCGLEGLNHQQMLKRFEEEYDSAEVSQQADVLIQAAKAFQASPLLKPLFTTA